jgi:hypothetical protein
MKDSPERKQLRTLKTQAAAVKRLKALVEEGILTEEEFSAKKREILGLESVGTLPGETT